MSFFRPMLTEHNLTEQQWRVLRALHDYSELETKELARRCCILNPSMTGIINRLQQQGFVSRKSSTQDQRKSLISLTPKASKLIHSLSPLVEAQYDVLVKQFGEKRLSELMQILRDLQALKY